MQQETPFDGLGEVTYVLLEFGDLNGISRSKQVTVEHFLSNWRDRVVRDSLPEGDYVSQAVGLGPTTL